MKKTLLLVDGSSYLYRAFHALPDLRGPQGEPTGALYGIINMLRRLRQDRPADYIACIFDAKGKTFRSEIFPEYKATRPPMPEELVKQIEPIYKVANILGWNVISVEGIEADDVIGTLASQAHAKGINTVISTGDKDMAQLVNDNTTLINTMTDEKLNVDGIVKKYGIEPHQFVDYLTLMGDNSDNVPGVTKCGPKTAEKWIKQYGTLDNLMENADKIAGAIGTNLRNALEWLPTARHLVTIKTDCDLSGHIKSIEESLKPKEPDNEALMRFFTYYGFKSWLKEAQNKTPAMQKSRKHKQTSEKAQQKTVPTKNAEKIKKEYETVLTQVQLDNWLHRIQNAELTSIDTETTSINPLNAELIGISLCCEAGKACYIPLAHTAPNPPQLPLKKVLEQLRPWLENPETKKVGQNLKYDLHVFANYGIELAGIAHDTLLQSYVLEAHQPHNLDSLAERYLGLKTITYESICGKGASQIGFNEVEINAATEYAAEDADVALRIHQVLFPQIEADKKLHFIYSRIEMPTADVLQKMERKGVLIDSSLLTAQSDSLGTELNSLEQKSYELAGHEFNLNSPKQISEILFSDLKLPIVKKTPSGAPSTDEEVLQKLAEDFPLPKLLLEHRGLAKLKSTYTDKLPKMILPKTGRVHTHYAQAVAVTGRLASNDPNLQNIPIRTPEGRRIREAFIAPENSVIISADYSQIELRIMAHISEDEGLLRAFANGEDIHRATASEIFGTLPLEITAEQRRYAKVINFGLIYGMSEFGLANSLGIERSAARQYIERYFQRYPGVARYMNDIRQQAKSNGFVETVFGRRLWLPEINSARAQRRQAAERAAINAPMQGTAADLIKLSMIAVQNWIESEKLKSAMIMQVHDELVLEVPESEVAYVREQLPKIMSQVAKFKAPLIAEIGIGKNWEEAH